VIRTALCAPVVALALALAPAAAASVIHHAPLEEVLAKADWVIVATVTEVQVREDSVQKLYTWTVRKDRELWSAAGVPDLPLMFSHRWPVMHGPGGEVIGTISPIYDGSGLEHDVRQGQAWIFMGKASSEGAEVLFVDRVEPLDLEAQIEVLLQQREVSGAATSTASGSSYQPPQTEPGDDGWTTYVDPVTWTARNTGDLRPGDASAEAAAVHYLASRVRGDRAFTQVLPPPGQRGERLTRQLRDHDAWRFHGFRLIGRKDAGEGDVWIKVWMEISAEGDHDEGTDELTLRPVGERWVVVEVPT